MSTETTGTKKSRNRRTGAEKARIISQVEEAIKTGRTATDACRDLGVAPSLITTWKQKLGKKAYAPRRKRVITAARKTPTAIPPKSLTLNLPVHSDESVTIILGRARDVVSALSQLNSIHAK